MTGCRVLWMGALPDPSCRRMTADRRGGFPHLANQRPWISKSPSFSTSLSWPFPLSRSGTCWTGIALIARRAPCQSWHFWVHPLHSNGTVATPALLRVGLKRGLQFRISFTHHFSCNISFEKVLIPPPTVVGHRVIALARSPAAS
jgi:hypothetical protein